MNKEELKEIFEGVYLEINQKMPFDKPYFKPIFIESSTGGEFVQNGFAYSKYKPVIKINAIYCCTKEKARQTLIHEFAHLISYNKRGRAKVSHDKFYWEITKELGYDYNDYPMHNSNLEKVFVIKQNLVNK